MDNVDICMITLLVCLLVYWAMWFKINCGRKLKGVERKDLPKELISRKKMTYDRLALSQHLKDVSQQLASSPKPLIAREFRFQGNFNSDLKAYTEMDSKKKVYDNCQKWAILPIYCSPRKKENILLKRRFKEEDVLSKKSNRKGRCLQHNRYADKMDRIKETSPRSEYNSWRRLARMNEDADKMDRIKETFPRSEYNSWRRRRRMNEDEGKINRFKETTPRSDHDSLRWRRRMNEDEDKMNRFKETTPRSEHDSLRRRRRMNEDEDKMNRFKETTPRTDHDSWRRRRRMNEGSKNENQTRTRKLTNSIELVYRPSSESEPVGYSQELVYCARSESEPVAYSEPRAYSQDLEIITLSKPHEVHQIEEAAYPLVWLPPPPPDPPNPP